MRKAGLTLLALGVSFAAALGGESWSGLCVSVADGDTITALRENERVRIRLYGIDCPESRQDYGARARQATSNLVYRQIVTVTVMDTDRYGRTVGLVQVDGVNVNEALVQDGLAWVYNQYCGTPDCAGWRNREGRARSAGIGLWEQKNPIPPWDWRRGKHSAGTKAPQSKAYHGNSSTMVFHRENCRNYNCRNCTALLPSRESAISAGYRPCGYCRP